MRRLVAVSACAAIALTVLAPAASAGSHSGRVPPGSWPVFPAGTMCPTAVGDVTVTYLGGNLSLAFKPDGRIMQAIGNGQLEASSDTGKSVVLTISGVNSISPDGNYNHTAGRALVGFFPGDPGPGDQGSGRLLYFVGNLTWTPTSFNYTGKFEDVCAMIS